MKKAAVPLLALLVAVVGCPVIDQLTESPQTEIALLTVKFLDNGQNQYCTEWLELTITGNGTTWDTAVSEGSNQHRLLPVGKYEITGGREALCAGGSGGWLPITDSVSLFAGGTTWTW